MAKSVTIKTLTKVARGVAYGDVSNLAVRNILTEISKCIKGKFTEQEMYDTMDYFDWKCPYTGKDMKHLVFDVKDGYATDHICPQNKEWCGLNIMGNLVLVDSTANDKKHDQTVEEFLLHDTKILTDVDLLGRTRQERLELIKDFQKHCGYDPEAIRKLVSPLLKAWYDEVADEQRSRIDKAMEELVRGGIEVATPKPLPEKGKAATRKTGSRKDNPDIIFYPSDEKQFKDELLKKKKARFVLTYDDGQVKRSDWDCSRFDASSGLRNNIMSRPFWRKRKEEGLVKVDVYID